MNKFPESKTFEFMKGAALTKIYISEYMVHLIFGEQFMIAVENVITFSDAATKSSHVYDVQKRRGELTVQQAIGRRVTRVETTEFELKLHFEHDGVVTLLTNESPCETCQIHTADGVYVY